MAGPVDVGKRYDLILTLTWHERLADAGTIAALLRRHAQKMHLASERRSAEDELEI